MQWSPVVYRSDGAWIGVLPSGELGVGVEQEGRASLRGSGFVPMWPFLEQGLAECLEKFTEAWESLGGTDISTPAELLELTAGSAWKSSRAYWKNLAAKWIAEMAGRPEFAGGSVKSIGAEVVGSGVLDRDVEERLKSALGE
ncbi:hypothetical protein LZG04_06000 [Saccharothrix sp. S26]|uniref:hypothetical protein n=1 Tax=Saccharothrix sp. S26 TaxID=2907215 RepID=UPI001F18B412|nr:hypothetical protein [Saccharothrix sp. S26]MCE6994366.1 hypothetical protein [Saccharothrix sp. S26]